MGIPLFELGKIVATPGCIEALSKRRVSAVDLLHRHVTGDWGECCIEDARTNDEAVKEGFRVFSVYQLSDEVKVWVITEADRSSTCLLLPSEY